METLARVHACGDMDKPLEDVIPFYPDSTKWFWTWHSKRDEVEDTGGTWRHVFTLRTCWTQGGKTIFPPSRPLGRGLWFQQPFVDEVGVPCNHTSPLHYWECIFIIPAGMAHCIQIRVWHCGAVELHANNAFLKAMKRGFSSWHQLAPYNSMDWDTQMLTLWFVRN